MKIDNRSNEEGGSRKLYTGLTTMKVVGVNPTMNELTELGYNPQQEPEYISVTPEGNAKVVIDFFLKHEETGMIAKRRFWLENRDRDTRAGDKKEYIDNYGQTSFAENEDSLQSWIDKNSAHPAKVGEGQLIRFIAAWANVNPYADAAGNRGLCYFEDVTKLFTNDLSEIRDIFDQIKDVNEIKVLLNVITTDEGKTYQDVYQHHYDRAASKSTKAWTNALANDYTQCKGDYQNSLEFKEYVAKPMVTNDTPDSATAVEPEVEAPW